jgi:hypothetical protein
MSNTTETTIRRLIILEHPRWTWEQIMAAVREALEGQGQYAYLVADLLAAEST